MTFLRAATPHEQGGSHFGMGKKLSECPFAKGTKEHRQWMRGWTDAKLKQQVTK